jgi:protocatechuate 4,5-dioxygenase, alpha chain
VPQLPPPPFDLSEPGTFLYSGPASTRGYRLNRFALSLRVPANRAEFLDGESAYMARFGLSPVERALVDARDWTGLLRVGGQLHAILKLAATVGESLYHIGAHNCGVDARTMQAACPRRVSGLGGLDG